MKVLTDNKYYGQIADVIREQNGTNNTYKPAQMVSALKDLFYEEVEGVPPISFNGIGENLLDYRIDGASGGVGDRTGNLVDKTKFAYGYRLSNIGTLYTTPSEQNLFAVSEFIEVNSGEQYIISQRDATRGYARRISFYQSKNENSWLSNNDDSDLIFTIPNTATYLKFTTLQNYIDSIMLRRGTSLPTTYEPYGYKVPVMVEGKNLLRNTATSQTINGVTFTVNSDKSVTVNGTATDSARLMLGAVELSAGEQYTMTGCPSGGSNNTYRLDPRRTNGSVLVSFIDTGNGSTYIPEADVKLNIYIYIQSGNILDNLTFYPMIRKADIEDDTYKPYHEPTTTNIYLDEPIGANESISLSDTNVNIPTIRGTNVLTVDTTVQPSNVYVKSRHESSYETAMRERYEEAQAQLDALESGGE